MKVGGVRPGLAPPPERGTSLRPPHSTLCEAFQRTSRAFDDETALRTPDDVTAVTWREYRERAEHVARGFASLGVGAGDTVGMMLSNRPELHIIDTAAVHLGATPFSIYNTSTAEQIEQMLRNAGNRVMVCESQFLQRIHRARAALPDLEHVVLVDGSERRDALTLERLQADGDRELDFERCWRSVTAEQIATVIYTSGTTGPPKGVMISHANLLAAWECSMLAVPKLARRGRYVSYLPTAHLADRMFSHYPALITGSEITCVDDPRAAIGHLKAIRPTLWLAVPRIWEKLKDAIEAGLAVGQLGLDTADLVVSGAAPIRADVLEFFAARGIEICEGYGMTESTAVGTLNLPGQQRFGTVGRPLPGVEVRLEEDGEVLLRSPAVMVGYRGEPEKTAEARDRAGWLHTGDIGQLDSDGYLRIVDRKKELIINAAGKNMSPANIEARLKAASSLIGHAIAIGDRRPYNTALIVLDPDTLALYAERRGLAKSTPAALAGDEQLLGEIAAALDEANSHLSRVEQIKRFTVLDHDWPAGSEQLTPTLKPKRRAIAERYAETIDAMYGNAK